MTIDDRLALCQRLTNLKAYRPRRRKGKRRFQDQRKRIIRKLRRAA